MSATCSDVLKAGRRSRSRSITALSRCSYPRASDPGRSRPAISWAAFDKRTRDSAMILLRS